MRKTNHLCPYSNGPDQIYRANYENEIHSLNMDIKFVLIKSELSSYHRVDRGLILNEVTLHGYLSVQMIFETCVLNIFLSNTF